LPAQEAAALLKARPAAVVTEVIAALDEWASQLRQHQKPEAAERVAELAAALDDNPGTLRRELREILMRRQLPVDRALSVLSAALRPVPVPLEIPLGKDRLRLRQLVEKMEKMDPTDEPTLGLLTLTRALRVAGEEALAERLLRAALTSRPQELVLWHTLGQLLTTQTPPRWGEAVVFYQAARSLRPDLGVNLAMALLQSGKAREGLDLLARMVRESPDNPFLYLQQGKALIEQGKSVEAEAACRKAITLKSNYAEAYNDLGITLFSQGKSVEAEVAYRKAIALNPEDAYAYNNLGAALGRQGKHTEAEAACRKAIALKPDHVLAYHNLGNALISRGRPVEAQAAFSKAIALKPDFAEAYNDLSIALDRQGKLVEAEGVLHKAIACKPDYATAYYNLGITLNDQQKFAKAEAAFREAIVLKPDYATAYTNLGKALFFQGKPAEAEAACRKAISLKPEYADAHCNLGILLNDLGKPVEAEAACRTALALKPDSAEAHCNLGSALRLQGRFAESLGEFRRAHELGSKQPGWRYPSLQQVGNAERLVNLAKKLPSVLKGEESAANPSEAITLAWMCERLDLKRHAASARLYADAFTAEPKLANDLNQQHRYYAARSAAQAAASQGKDVHLLPDKVKAMYRCWALGWLRDDLTAYGKLAEQSNPVANRAIQQRLTYWQRDPDLASLRDKDAVDKLPETDRETCHKLWTDVVALIQQTQEK
jgi:Flp pilus assembly protein TadD